jgi:hypothetical protein
MPSPRITGSRCLCRTCGEYFNSVSMFDRHRVGEYPTRRCLTPEQMLERGYSVNEAGFWIERARLDRTRRNGDWLVAATPAHP